MIRLTDVQKEYENGTHALRGVTMEVNDGEFVFLVGPSGLSLIHISEPTRL